MKNNSRAKKENKILQTAAIAISVVIILIAIVCGVPKSVKWIYQNEKWPGIAICNSVFDKFKPIPAWENGFKPTKGVTNIDAFDADEIFVIQETGGYFKVAVMAPNMVSIYHEITNERGISYGTFQLLLDEKNPKFLGIIKDEVVFSGDGIYYLLQRNGEVEKLTPEEYNKINSNLKQPQKL